MKMICSTHKHKEHGDLGDLSAVLAACIRVHGNSAMPTDLRMVGNTLFNVLLPLAAQILKDQLHKTLIFAVDFKYLWLTRALFPYLDITWYDVVGWLPLDHRKKKVRPMFHGSQSLIPLVNILAGMCSPYYVFALFLVVQSQRGSLDVVELYTN